ncbi:MAG: hypothetical protein GY697_10745 [Desulfobacterales bacterium]|nr:hypothetical protein [Desulfobacterales bacterium]
MPKREPIYRITIDEFLAEDLARILFAELDISKTAALFDDTTDNWKEEQALVLTPESWAAKLALPPTGLKPYPFDSFFEGQVFLCGNVSLNRSRKSKKIFRINKTPARRLLPITSQVHADIKSLYKKALTGGQS